MKRMISLQQQRGYLTLITVVLIVIVGFIAVALAYITFGSAFATVNLQDSNSALYIAESGLEDATHSLLAHTLTNRSTCTGLSITNSAIGAGAYAVTSTGPFYTSSATTLNGALTAAATSITVASTANYQSSGRIMIDHERINYAAVDATHFLYAQRGVDGSIASSHATLAPVGQYQCNLSSQGGVPSLSPTPIYIGGKRLLTEAIQLQEGWAAGDTLSGPTNWNLAHWNTPTEKVWTQQAPAIAPTQNLNAVSIVSNVDVWVVGSQAAALHFNGSTWTNTNTGITGGDNLSAVTGISSKEAWACSSQGKIYHWTGAASWSNTNAGATLNGMSMLDATGSGIATTGWVVGNNKSAFLYNGTTWTATNSGITFDLNAVSTLSATDAWVAGKTGGIFHWTGGASWAAVSTPSATPTLNGISMIKSGASDIGWAVGTGSVAWFYNGTTWASSNTGLPGGLTLNGVVTVSPNEAWLVENNGGIYEWNGTTWTLVFTSAKALNGIDMLHPNSQPFSAWTENFG